MTEYQLGIIESEIEHAKEFAGDFQGIAKLVYRKALRDANDIILSPEITELLSPSSDFNEYMNIQRSIDATITGEHECWGFESEYVEGLMCAKYILEGIFEDPENLYNFETSDY